MAMTARIASVYFNKPLVLSRLQNISLNLAFTFHALLGGQICFAAISYVHPISKFSREFLWLFFSFTLINLLAESLLQPGKLGPRSFSWHIVIVHNPKVPRPYLFFDGQNMYNRVVLVCTVNVCIPASLGRWPNLRYQVLQISKNLYSLYL